MQVLDSLVILASLGESARAGERTPDIQTLKIHQFQKYARRVAVGARERRLICHFHQELRKLHQLCAVFAKRSVMVM